MAKRKQPRRSWDQPRTSPGAGVPYRPQALGGEHIASEPALAFNVDADGTITYVHQSLPTWGADEIGDSTVYEHLDPTYHDTVRYALSRVFADGEGEAIDCRGFLPFEPDTWFYCRLLANVLSEEVVSVTVVLRDISAWKQESVEAESERERLRAESAEGRARVAELEGRRSRDEERIEQLEKDVARLTATLRQREAEAKRLQARFEREGEGRKDLLSEVERLKLLLEYREEDYQRESTQHVVDQAMNASAVAEHTTRWHRAERRLEDERAHYEEEVRRLNDELAKQAYWLDRKDRERDRLRLILDQAAEALLIVDPADGRFVDANETACRWLRHSREKLTTLTLDAVGLEFSLDSDQEFREHVVDTRKRNRAQTVHNATVRRRDGSTFAVEVAISRAQIGGQEYRLLVARDANRRRQIEEAQRESEERFRNLFDLSPDAMYLSARDGTVSDANPAALVLFGYTRKEILGLDAGRLYERVEDIRRFQDAVERDGSVQGLQVDFRAKDGTVFHGLLTSTLHHAGDGEPVGYQCVIRPVSSNGTAVADAAPGPAG